MKTSVADLHSRVLCLRIVPVSGATIRLARYPKNLIMGNGAIYLSGSGYEITGYSSDITMSPGMVDLQGIADIAGIGYDEISSGLFDGAKCYLFATSFDDPVEDEEPITASIMGKTTLIDDTFKIEEMAITDALNQNVGKVYAATCQKTFGGQEFAGCKIDTAALTVTGTLTGVYSRSIFRDVARLEAFDYFAGGSITFTGGANAGLAAAGIKRYTNGVIELQEPLYYNPAAGDTYTMIPGCRKRLGDCRDKFNNVANFGGFPWVPTGVQYTQVADSNRNAASADPEGIEATPPKYPSDLTALIFVASL